MEMEAFTFKLSCQSLKDYWRLTVWTSNLKLNMTTICNISKWHPSLSVIIHTFSKHVLKNALKPSFSHCTEVIASWIVITDTPTKILDWQWYLCENNPHFIPDYYIIIYLQSLLISTSLQNFSVWCQCQVLVDSMVNFYYHNSRLTPEKESFFMVFTVPTAIKTQYWLFFESLHKALKHKTHT